MNLPEENLPTGNAAADTPETRDVTTASGRKFVLNTNPVTEEPPEEDLSPLMERKLEFDRPEKKKEKGGWFAFLFELFFIFLIVFGIRTFIAAPFQVEGSSMDDTLHDGEKIFINKLPTHFGGIDRGDIIVFKPPAYGMMPKQGPVCWIKQKFSEETDLRELCGEEPQHFVKRVIGVAGDTVEIQGGKVFLTESGGERVQLEEEYLNDLNHGRTCFNNATCASENDLKGYEFVVPEGKVLVLGDNRLRSTDSRSAFSPGSFNNGTPEPFVPLENIVGVVKVVIWPPEDWKWIGAGE